MTQPLDEWATRQLLWDTYEPYSIWVIFALIGVGSMFAIIAYNLAVKAADANPKHGLNTRGEFWVRAFLFPIFAAFVVATAIDFSLGLILNTCFFGLMLLVSYIKTPGKPAAETAEVT